MRHYVAMAILALAAGCANTEPQAYARSDAQTVAFGAVESVQPVRFSENEPIEAILAGAAIGDILGEIVGNGGVAAAVLGTVAGGFVGNAVQRKAWNKEEQEIAIRLDNGSTVSVVQPGMQDFEPGQRVRVVTGPKGSRVEPD